MVVDTFSSLITVINNDKADKQSFNISLVGELKAAIEKNIADVPRDELLYIDGLLFSAESLVESLKKLAGLYRVPDRVRHAE
jgi:hypothetical protein